MTIDEFRDDFSNQLSEMYEPEEVGNLCTLTLEHVLSMNRVEVSLSRKQKLSPSQQSQLEEVLSRLKKGEPIQYITGKTEFYGLEFQVNPSTLIPRPETEELVEWVLEEVQITNDRLRVKNDITLSPSKRIEGLQQDQLDSVKILDIGTGSGCIAISLAKELKGCKVEGIDISQNALATAYQNANANQTEVAFYHQDILETESLNENYDIIVSNPPYVREQEKAVMRLNVLSNEPASALFVTDDDPLIFYRKIGKLAYYSLTEKGMLFFEINEYFGRETIDLLRGMGFRDILLKKDMFGKDRMIRARKEKVIGKS